MTVSRPGDRRRPVALPVERPVDHHRRGASPAPSPRRRSRGRRPRSPGHVGERARRVPVDLAVDRLGVRVDQQLGRVEPHARRVARTARGPGSRSAVPGPMPGTKPCQLCAVYMGRSMRSSLSSSSKRHSSTRSASSENREKLTPAPVQWRRGGRAARARSHRVIATRAPARGGRWMVAFAGSRSSAVSPWVATTTSRPSQGTDWAVSAKLATRV